MHNVDDGDIGPWDVSAGCKGFGESLRGIEEGLPEPEFADAYREGGVVQVGEAVE